MIIFSLLFKLIDYPKINKLIIHNRFFFFFFKKSPSLAFILLTNFLKCGSKLLLWNVSKDYLGFQDHLSICLESLAWSNHAKFHFGKRLLTERSFPLSIFWVSTFNSLIAHKILRRKIDWSKHQFFCLCGNTLSHHTHYFHALSSHVFVLSWTKRTIFLIVPVHTMRFFCAVKSPHLSRQII